MTNGGGKALRAVITCFFPANPPPNKFQGVRITTTTFTALKTTKEKRKKFAVDEWIVKPRRAGVRRSEKVKSTAKDFTQCMTFGF